jgi:hypothetical protein
MIQASQKTLEAIAALSTDEAFLLFVRWIEDSGKDLMHSNINVKDELQLRWNQGKLQNMNDILEAVSEVHTLLMAYKDYVPSGTNPDI